MSKPLSVAERIAQARARLATAQAAPAPQPATAMVAPSANTFQDTPAAPKLESVVDVTNTGEGGKYAPFKAVLAELEDRLNENLPDFSMQLRDIHEIMREDPNVQTVLSPEEIGVIVRGFKTHTNVTITTTPTRTSKKRTQPLTAFKPGDI